MWNVRRVKKALGTQTRTIYRHVSHAPSVTLTRKQSVFVLQQQMRFAESVMLGKEYFTIEHIIKVDRLQFLLLMCEFASLYSQLKFLIENNFLS